MRQKQTSKQPVYSVNGLDLKKYERDGVDISLLTASLRYSPTERAENNKAMLLFIEEAKRAREKNHNART